MSERLDLKTFRLIIFEVHLQSPPKQLGVPLGTQHNKLLMTVSHVGFCYGF